MEDDIQTTASEDVTTDPVETTETKKANVPADESTLGELLDKSEDDGSQTVPVKDNNGETVPLSAFLDIKKEVKKLQKQLSEKTITDEEVGESLNELLDSYDVDPKFVKSFLKIAKEEARKELQPEIDNLRNKDRATNVQSTLKKMLNDSITRNPEYQEVVNEDVILQLANDPKNRKKTMSQLIEETYGKVLERGSRSIETQTGGRNKPSEPDFNKMTESEESEVYKDPELRKKYAKHQSKMIQDLI